MIKVYSRQVGFTLIEMAVVLVIVGLLIGSGFSMFGPYMDNAKQSHTKGNLETIKGSLLNYVKVNRYMPCPDGDGDGKADSTGNQCDVQFGTIPFDDLGVAKATASDDWGNLFGYGIHAKAIDSAVMSLDVTDDTDAETLKDTPGSYFYRTRAPAFDLDTPPTVIDPDVLADSFTICKRTAANDCDADDDGVADLATDIELRYIPAVIIAFNENGGITTLNGCAGGSRGDRELENCDQVDMLLTKGIFNDDFYDDQIATISAYEIKQQVLDILNSISTSNVADWDSYTHIINAEFAGTNDLNSADGTNNEFLVTGNIANNGTIGLQGGDDILAVLGYMQASVINGGNGDDLLLVTRDDYADLAALTTLMTEQGNHNVEYICYYFALDECYSIVEGTGSNDDVLTAVADPNSGTIDDLLDRVR